MNLGNLDSLTFFYPELILLGGILLVIISDIALKGLRNHVNLLLSLAALVLALIYTLQTDHGSAMTLFEGMLALDNFALYFKVFLLVAGILVLLGSLHSEELAAVHQGEFHALLLAVTLGMLLMANSAHLVMLYLSLELVSLTSYIMVGYLRSDRLSNEASMKYILFGAVFDRGHAVWILPAVRLDRKPRSLGDSGGLAGSGSGRVQSGYPVTGGGVDHGRFRVQDGRGALSFLVPGRLYRSAHTSHGLSVGSSESRGVCHSGALLSEWNESTGGGAVGIYQWHRLAPGAYRGVGADHEPGKHRPLSPRTT